MRSPTSRSADQRWRTCSTSPPALLALRLEVLASSSGTGGGAALKMAVTEAVNEGLRAHRERRMVYAADPSQLTQILRSGNAVAASVAEQTLAEVREVMSMDY